MIGKIVSGGQTGADRAALDAAIEAGVAYGGWAPKGRLDEHGEIPASYTDLTETGVDSFDTRTEWNVRDSDATLILAHGSLFGGSALTAEKAAALGKPSLHVDLFGRSEAEAIEIIREWLEGVRPATLNVAGPRASDDPAIYAKTKRIVKAILDMNSVRATP